MKEKIQKHSTSNPIYAFGFFGALIYYILHAGSFWAGVVGVLKAFVWPGVLVYELLKFVSA